MKVAFPSLRLEDKSASLSSLSFKAPTTVFQYNLMQLNSVDSSAHLCGKWLLCDRHGLRIQRSSSGMALTAIWA